MRDIRQCGILLHPTSLPTKYGIGDLGNTAYEFIDFLIDSNQKLWQVLPLNPVGYGESPYQGLSAFAGNPLLISIDGLVEAELLSLADINPPTFNTNRVEYDKVKEFKYPLFEKAYLNFKNSPKPGSYSDFISDNKYWLEDFALFMSLKEHYKGLAWNRWDRPIANRDHDSIEHYKKKLIDRINFNYFLQYTFFTQWQKVREYANNHGIKIIGDLPIYVSYDSSDTWSKHNLFLLDETGTPKVVSGVPPDYFSETGQLWGNPIYNWSVMEKDNYYWWQQRFNAAFKIADIVRVDHFRGFEAYWEVPFGEETAINGEWVKAPGEKLFTVIKNHFGDLPIIAEDLGVITAEVNELKDKFEFPGMKILHFTFESDELEHFSPYYMDKNTVVYTGTHDNDTTVGWLRTKRVENSKILKRLAEYFYIHNEMSIEDVCWRMIEIAYQSPAYTCIIPLQDILCLDTNARMNYPGTVGKNWNWRFKSGELTDQLSDKLKKIAQFYNR